MPIIKRLLCFAMCLLATTLPSSADFLRIDGALAGGGDCPLFGIWDASSGTCVIHQAVLPLGDRLDIASATVDVAGTMTNDGLLVNDGILLVRGTLVNANDMVNNWTGAMVVRGTFFSHFMYNFGSLTNEPSGSVDFNFFLENNGPLLNRGDLRIGATVFNIPERVIENLGSIEVTVTGSLSNEGILVHAGQLDNQGTIENGATFIEHCDSELTGNSPTGDPSTSAQSMSVAKESLSWCEVPGTTGYDVIAGDLALLRDGGGDFSMATLECLGDSVAVLSLGHSITPPSGSAFWFLVQANGVPSAGFDTVFSSQVGERASEIESSTGTCP